MAAADMKTLDVTLKRVINLANIVINGTNVESLLAYYGLKSDSRPDAAKIKAWVDILLASIVPKIFSCKNDANILFSFDF